ncbi:hypothetical protein DUNSADRAFT_14750 [Dunaliella salina]|uniref:Uncharacterized protein n=1 Tax=Dunaliella salina TaxID=3046 RepID=A0ABQ7G6S7_DUNSA|nr:hypothetical protein DUNSADRAFT_14750 [Dunaliella salina]|eukprot:KAF5830319.1 hypothetical protein DUNSADRAFT_14750 [Dunaliella salina]
MDMRGPWQKGMRRGGKLKTNILRSTYIKQQLRYSFGYCYCYN